MSAYEKLLAARSKDRLTALTFIGGIFEDFLEMHGDRRFADDPAIVCGVARLDGRPVTVIGIEKGTDTESRIMRNFGYPKPEGYRKALRAMKQAEKFSRPVICFVDTAGAFCGAEAEERGQGQAIAENLYEMMGLRTPIVSVMIGEGGSGGALALAVSDRVLMLENAVYSVISPEGCASILWKDAKRVADAAECLKITAQDMLELGVVEEVISEDCGTAALPERVKGSILSALAEISDDTATMMENRYARFQKMGREHLTEYSEASIETPAEGKE